MGYADFSSMLAQLSLSASNPDDAADVALAHEVDDAVAIQFERQAGFDVARTPIWGVSVTATPTLRIVDGPLAPAFYGTRTPFYGGVMTDLLTLPAPVRSVSDVQIVGENAETFDGSQWIAYRPDARGHALMLQRIDSRGWPWGDGRTRIHVTALWSDGPVGGAPPAIVTKACTFIAVDEFRMRKSSPTGEIGPDGFTIRPRNPWTFNLVQTAIEAVQVPSLAMLVM